MSLADLLANIDLELHPPASGSLHPFSRDAPDVAILNSLLEQTNQLHSALLQHQTLEPDQRLVALLKEHTEHSNTTRQTEHDAESRKTALGALYRPRLYGEDVPFDRSQLPQYVISRIETCATAAGLDVFIDQPDENTLFICGGKLLVLDITVVNHTLSSEGSSKPAPSSLTVSLASLKISHAQPTDDSPSLPPLPSDVYLSNLLASTVRSFITECHKQNPVADALKVSLLLQKFRLHLEYLFHLDGLAAEAPGGIRWLREVGVVTEDMTAIMLREADTVSMYDVFQTIPCMLHSHIITGILGKQVSITI